MKKKLTQEIFKDQPKEVNWAGVDYDGMLSFGVAIQPRYTWASERWRGFNLIGNTVNNTDYEPLTSIWKEFNIENQQEYEDGHRQAEQEINIFDEDSIDED